MQSHIFDASLNIEAWIPYTRPKHINTITLSILSQVQNLQKQQLRFNIATVVI
jgi:hypothetical protein